MLTKFIILTIITTVAVGSGVLVAISKSVAADTSLGRILWWWVAVFWFLGMMSATIAVAQAWIAGA